MTRCISVLCAATVAAMTLLACRSASESQPPSPSAPSASPVQAPASVVSAPASMPMMGAPSAPTGMAGMCPMEVPQTKVSVSDVPEGIALDFATTPDGVAEVRRRVGVMAQMHNTMAQDGGMSGHEGGHMHGDGGKMVAAHAAEQDTPQGARLVLHAAKPADVDALRSHVREHAAMMQQGHCPMMSEMQHGAMPGGMHHMH